MNFVGSRVDELRRLEVLFALRKVHLLPRPRMDRLEQRVRPSVVDSLPPFEAKRRKLLNQFEREGWRTPIGPMHVARAHPPIAEAVALEYRDIKVEPLLILDQAQRLIKADVLAELRVWVKLRDALLGRHAERSRERRCEVFISCPRLLRLLAWKPPAVETDQGRRRETVLRQRSQTLQHVFKPAWLAMIRGIFELVHGNHVVVQHEAARKESKISLLPKPGRASTGTPLPTG